MRQRLGGKQVAAGPAGGQQDRALGHYSAGTARGGIRVSPICVRFSGRLRVSASTMPIEMAIAIMRGAAIGDERQRHALGRHQLQIDRHVDDRLEAEHDDQPGHGIAREVVVLLQRDASGRA